MDELEMIKIITENQQRSKSNTHQIQELKPIVEEIHTMGKTLVVLCEKMETTNKNITALTEDMEEIKSAEGKQARELKNKFATAMMGALAGSIVTVIIQVLRTFL